MFLSEWREFPSAPFLAEKKNLTARVSMLLKSRASLTCFRACFLPGLARDLSALRYCNCTTSVWGLKLSPELSNTYKEFYINILFVRK